MTITFVFEPFKFYNLPLQLITKEIRKSSKNIPIFVLSITAMKRYWNNNVVIVQ